MFINSIRTHSFTFRQLKDLSYGNIISYIKTLNKYGNEKLTPPTNSANKKTIFVDGFANTTMSYYNKLDELDQETFPNKTLILAMFKGNVKLKYLIEFKVAEELIGQKFPNLATFEVKTRYYLFQISQVSQLDIKAK